jgi:hypothetical protein
MPQASPAASTIDPHASHAGHRPTHFGVLWPQTSHSYVVRVAAFAADLPVDAFPVADVTPGG